MRYLVGLRVVSPWSKVRVGLGAGCPEHGTQLHQPADHVGLEVTPLLLSLENARSACEGLECCALADHLLQTLQRDQGARGMRLASLGERSLAARSRLAASGC